MSHILAGNCRPNCASLLAAQGSGQCPQDRNQGWIDTSSRTGREDKPADSENIRSPIHRPIQMVFLLTRVVNMKTDWSIYLGMTGQPFPTCQPTAYLE